MKGQGESHLTNPHDRFFRHFLGHPERARAFIQHFLPKPVVAHLDLNALEVVDASFVDPDLRSHQGDLLCRTRLRSGEEAYVYFLFEHKSYPDPWVGWQVLRYMMRIWEGMWREERRLVPIVPVVVYHGERVWQAPTDFGTLLGVPEGMRPHVPDFAYLLYDLNIIEDAALQVDAMLAAGLLLMKYIRRPELRERLDAIGRLMREVMEAETGVEAVVALLRYLAEAGRYVGEEDVERVVKALPRGGEIMATVAQKWVEQGLQRGLEQGLLRARREDILALLEMRLQPRREWLDYVAQQLERIDDAARLQALHLAAAQVSSPQEFEAQLAEG